MMADELLRQTALILDDGWSQGANARDDAGSIVPLFVGVPRDATAFSPYVAFSMRTGTRASVTRT
jgi:hypothetical protein